MSPCAVWCVLIHRSPVDRLRSGGDDGIRTHDPLLAGQVLSQLSYTPAQGFPLRGVGADLFSRAVSGEVSSALHSLTSVFGMGTGGPCALTAPTTIRDTCYSITVSLGH